MPRPQLPAAVVRSKTISIRISDAENARLERIERQLKRLTNIPLLRSQVLMRALDLGLRELESIAARTAL